MNLSKQLVLFNYLLNQFGFEKFEFLQSKYKDDELKAGTSEHSSFYTNLSDKVKFSSSDLKIYDENILKHLNTINIHRSPKINLKYYQYFSLLFTEYYLHQYFQDKDGFTEQLDEFQTEFCKNNLIKDLEPYKKEEINLLAYWQATGSGKTFTLHFNVLQFIHYGKKYNKKLNNLILLTPSENLSKQHLEELTLSGIEAQYYLDNKSGNHVKVIDIHKIKEISSGQGVTISVSEFGQQNGLFVDEGHKGNDNEESVWRGLRERIGFNGFTFEYSATFGQVSEPLQRYYAKNVIFDYSYKYFYKDGYGKDYWIHNIGDKRTLDNEKSKRQYLLLNTLLFVQQKYYYKQNTDLLLTYQIENPLLIFVGHTVNPKPKKGNKTDAEQKDDEVTISDIKILLDYLSDFLKNSHVYEKYILQLMEGIGFLYNEYKSKLSYLFSKVKSPKQIYDLIIKDVFNAVTQDEIELHVLRNSSGEIALKVKGNNPYFGLINIGDVNTFKSKLSKEYSFEKSNFSESLFQTLSARINKPLNILIGARKFIEGWNNYRVSSIGLINFGRSEGSQIIQLFGRGVRLHGQNNSLKRSTEYNRLDENMPIVETLNIFGLNANYMQRFKNDLEKEGIRTSIKKILVPINLYAKTGGISINSLNLITLKKSTNINLFNTTSVYPLHYNKEITITLDLTTKILAFSSGKPEIEHIKPVVLESLEKFEDFVDFNILFLNLVEYKIQKGYNNIAISQNRLPELLTKMHFKVLTDEELKINSIKDIQNIQKIVLSLLRRYIDSFYNRLQRVYEAQQIKSAKLTNKDEAFHNLNYVLEINEIDDSGNKHTDIDKLTKEIEDFVIQAQKDIKNYKGSKILLNSWFEKHLYQPLLIDAENQEHKYHINTITPKGLNVGEASFVEHLSQFVSSEYGKGNLIDCEFYLLRNNTRSKGLGFYFSSAGGFFPDFLLWIKKTEQKNVKQYLSFIDPHGLRNEKGGFESDKIMLHKNIKELESLKSIKGIKLSSFIICPSSFKEAGIDRWYKPVGIDLKTYSENLNIFAISKKGDIDEVSYIRKIVARILS